jgi:hypothetical protein
VTPRTFRVVRTLTVIFTLTVYSAFAATSSSTPPWGVAGLWSGTLVGDGARFRLVLHVTSDSAGKLGVSIDSVDQDAMGIPGSNATFNGNSFAFEVPSVNGKYLGTLTSDGSTLKGTWTQRKPDRPGDLRVPSQRMGIADTFSYGSRRWGLPFLHQLLSVQGSQR